MTTKQDAIKLALEALKVNHEWHIITDDHDGYPDSELCNQNTKAIAALATLSESLPQGTPVQDGDALRKALNDAWDRMDRARNILTDGKPTPNCNWGMLDTELDRKALSQSAQPSDKACKGIPRKGCNYMAACDTFCNKCGEVHKHHQMVAQFSQAEARTGDEKPVQAVATVPMHPLSDALWANTQPIGSIGDRPAHYPLMTLYASPQASTPAALDATQQAGRDDVIEEVAKAIDDRGVRMVNTAWVVEFIRELKGSK